MKKITFLILLLAGIPAAAQHPVPPERQALIRRVAVPILADTLKTAAGRSSKSFSTNYNYKADIFGSARMEYGLQDDLVYLRWPLQISVTVNEGWGNKNDYAWADYSGLTGQCDYTTELVGDKRLKKKPTDTLLAWLLYVGGYFAFAPWLYAARSMTMGASFCMCDSRVGAMPSHISALVWFDAMQSEPTPSPPSPPAPSRAAAARASTGPPPPMR